MQKCEKENEFVKNIFCIVRYHTLRPTDLLSTGSSCVTSKLTVSDELCLPVHMLLRGTNHLSDANFEALTGLYLSRRLLGCDAMRCGRIPRQHGPLKRWYPTTILHGVTTLKTST
jgi:hypothetical protein